MVSNYILVIFKVWCDDLWTTSWLINGIKVDGSTNSYQKSYWPNHLVTNNDISKSIVQPTPCIESLTNQDVQVTCFIDGVSNNGPRVCGWNSSSSSGKIPIIMDRLTLKENIVGISSMNKGHTFDWKKDVEHYISKMTYKPFFKKKMAYKPNIWSFRLKWSFQLYLCDCSKYNVMMLTPLS